ncbi:EAL domain-containing protein [Pectobacteriaceae bacterium CE90]|nr:EAL domain-containing protein [Prodigiosinella sp. LS101]WJV52643.1 EAL domain-containing protein [Prodigiosinella sp. LS101]WJV56997.1 EAL domain-containing protein [Pectobacteriaceae bacterium C111]WJY16287.1 EAL domain-containing protein [Pectobacteriaceae bacterium CE90]
MKLDSRIDFYYTYEPIVDSYGRIFCFEMLTRLKMANSGRNQCIFSELSPELKIKIFINQLSIIICNAKLYIENNILVSINIDHDIAKFIHDDDEVCEILKNAHYIRLEINEFFPEFRHNSDGFLLSYLSSLCPLWLDDFGAGLTSLSIVMTKNFEYIKIDKNYFWKHRGTDSFLRTLSHIRPYTQGIIIEGIEKDADIACLEGIKNVAMQGYKWPPFSQARLIRWALKKMH